MLIIVSLHIFRGRKRYQWRELTPDPIRASCRRRQVATRTASRRWSPSWPNCIATTLYSCRCVTVTSANRIRRCQWLASPNWHKPALSTNWKQSLSCRIDRSSTKPTPTPENWYRLCSVICADNKKWVRCSQTSLSASPLAPNFRKKVLYQVQVKR